MVSGGRDSRNILSPSSRCRRAGTGSPRVEDQAKDVAHLPVLLDEEYVALPHAVERFVVRMVLAVLIEKLAALRARSAATRSSSKTSTGSFAVRAAPLACVTDARADADVELEIPPPRACPVEPAPNSECTTAGRRG